MSITPILINVKDGIVKLEEDSIKLHQYQINQIKKNAIKRTCQEWTNSNGIKIPLTPKQQKEIVNIKNQILQVLSPSKDPEEVLLQRKGIGFSQHAFERIDVLPIFHYVLNSSYKPCNALVFVLHNNRTLLMCS